MTFLPRGAGSRLLRGLVADDGKLPWMTVFDTRKKFTRTSSILTRRWEKDGFGRERDWLSWSNFSINLAGRSGWMGLLAFDFLVFSPSYLVFVGVWVFLSVWLGSMEA